MLSQYSGTNSTPALLLLLWPLKRNEPSIATSSGYTVVLAWDAWIHPHFQQCWLLLFPRDRVAASYQMSVALSPFLSWVLSLRGNISELPPVAVLKWGISFQGFRDRIPWQKASYGRKGLFVLWLTVPEGILWVLGRKAWQWESEAVRSQETEIQFHSHTGSKVGP